MPRVQHWHARSKAGLRRDKFISADLDSGNGIICNSATSFSRVRAKTGSATGS